MRSNAMKTLALADANGNILCGQAPPESPQPADQTAQFTARQAGNVTVWTAPAISASGKNYLFIAVVPVHQEQHTWYEDLYHFASPQLPVAIAIGGLTTFVLVLIFTRPVVRLREAALQLAQGNLTARVREPASEAGFFKGDEFDALVHGFNHMAERLESLVNAQKLLLRDVSHELRSPLARLSVALELSREDADSTMNTHLDRIERETERLNQLIGQLLTLSSMEAAEGLGQFERVSLKHLARRDDARRHVRSATERCLRRRFTQNATVLSMAVASCCTAPSRMWFATLCATPKPEHELRSD